MTTLSASPSLLFNVRQHAYASSGHYDSGAVAKSVFIQQNEIVKSKFGRALSLSDPSEGTATGLHRSSVSLSTIVVGGLLLSRCNTRSPPRLEKSYLWPDSEASHFHSSSALDDLANVTRNSAHAQECRRPRYMTLKGD